MLYTPNDIRKMTEEVYKDDPRLEKILKEHDKAAEKAKRESTHRVHVPNTSIVNEYPDEKGEAIFFMEEGIQTWLQYSEKKYVSAKHYFSELRESVESAIRQGIYSPEDIVALWKTAIQTDLEMNQIQSQCIDHVEEIKNNGFTINSQKIIDVQQQAFKQMDEAMARYKEKIMDIDKQYPYIKEIRALEKKIQDARLQNECLNYIDYPQNSVGAYDSWINGKRINSVDALIRETYIYKQEVEKLNNQPINQDKSTQIKARNISEYLRDGYTSASPDTYNGFLNAFEKQHHIEFTKSALLNNIIGEYGVRNDIEKERSFSSYIDKEFETYVSAITPKIHVSRDLNIVTEKEAESFIHENPIIEKIAEGYEQLLKETGYTEENIKKICVLESIDALRDLTGRFEHKFENISMSIESLDTANKIFNGIGYMISDALDNLYKTNENYHDLEDDINYRHKNIQNALSRLTELSYDCRRLNNPVYENYCKTKSPFDKDEFLQDVACKEIEYANKLDNVYSQEENIALDKEKMQQDKHFLSYLAEHVDSRVMDNINKVFDGLIDKISYDNNDYFDFINVEAALEDYVSFEQHQDYSDFVLTRDHPDQDITQELYADCKEHWQEYYASPELANVLLETGIFTEEMYHDFGEYRYDPYEDYEVEYDEYEEEEEEEEYDGPYDKEDISLEETITMGTAQAKADDKQLEQAREIEPVKQANGTNFDDGQDR